MKSFIKKIILKWYRWARDSENQMIYSARNKKLDGTRVAGKANLLKVAERVTFGGDVFIMVNASVEIGHDTMIATGVKIITSTHDYNNHPMWKHRVDMPVRIGNHVWIGANAIIMPGVKLGDYSVIGAGSVVTKNVPEGFIVTGNPAEFLKQRVLGEYDQDCIYPGVVLERDFLNEQKTITNA